MTDFFDIAVTPAVLDTQERKGSLGMYTTAPGAGPGQFHTLDESEIEFITSRDSLYLATVSETGWPYVQHRGGEPGFVKTLDNHTIGWAERNGNRQYIGTSNINANGRIAAILVDYPSRSRIKIYGQATYHPEPSSELLTRLEAKDIRNDGAITIKILATAWNCPKFITPRFTESEVAELVGSLKDRINELERQLASQDPTN